MKWLFVIVLCVGMLYGSIHEEQYIENIKNADMGIPVIKEIKAIDIFNKGLKFIYYGYLPYWVDTLYYANFRHELLTDIAYFSVELNTDGSIGSVPNASRFTTAYNYCRRYGIDMHMTFTLFGSTSVSTFLNNSSSRSTAISNISDFVSTYDCDGINIDFEYVTSFVKDSFTDFINETSLAMHNHTDGRKELFIAMPAVPSWYPGYDYFYLGQYSDGLFIMTYDYHYSGSANAGPVAPTYNSVFWGYYAVNTTIGDCLDEGVFRDKIILGIPYYGYDWTTVDDSRNSSTTGSGSAVLYKYAKANALTHNREWDNDAYVPFYDYYSAEWHQCWYDDSVSIEAKLGIAVDNLLLGAGCWALGYDEGEDDLWNCIENAFWYEAPLDHFVVQVNTSALNIRKGPGSDYDILSVTNADEKFVAFDYIDNWYKVYYPSKSGPYYGWLWGGDGTDYKYLEGVIQDTILRITASLLNVRAGPTTDSTIITQISRGQCFVPDSFSGNWARLILPDNNEIGWIYYTAYSNLIPSPEDSNQYNAIIDSIIYTDTVNSLDTFTVNIYIDNNSNTVIGNNVYFRTNFDSEFYYSLLWDDARTAQTIGYAGLVNQKFRRHSIFQAPSISDTQIISGYFHLYKDNMISDSIELQVTVLGNIASIKEEKINTKKRIKAVYEICIYDIMGRKLQEYQAYSPNIENLKLKKGIYFAIIKGDNGIERKKILRLK